MLSIRVFPPPCRLPPWGCTTYANAAGRANITSFQQLHIVHARCRSWPCTCYRFTWKLLAGTFRRNDYKWVTGYANVSFSRSACDDGRESGVMVECHRQRAPLVSYVFRRRLLGEDTLQMRLKVVQENSESFCSSCILSVVSCNFNISSWARSTVQHAATTCSNWPGSQAERGPGLQGSYAWGRPT